MTHAGSRVSAAVLDAGTATEEAEWFVLYVIVRHEKKVERLLSRQGIESFLPCRTVRSRADRDKSVEVPLFPGYVFVRIAPRQRVQALKTDGVVRILGIRSEPIAVPDAEIVAMRTIVESDLVYEPVDYFPNGREVRVLGGALRGVRGRVVDHRGRHRLVICSDLIQRSVAVELDVLDVELI